MTIYGIGIDMSEIQRFEELKTNSHFLERIFGEAEIEEFQKSNYNTSSICAAFCVKEAFAKSLGTGVKGFSFNEVCTLHEVSGKPYIKLCGKASEIAASLNLSFQVSITHTKENAAAVVIALKEP